MIHTDRCKNTQNSCIYYICRIKKSTHSGFQNDIIRLFFSEIEKCDRCFYLENSYGEIRFFFYFFCCLFHLRYKRGELVLRHPLAINLKSFHISHHGRRTVSSGPVSSLLQDTGESGENRSFSISPGYMYKFQIFLRISKLTQ